MFFFYTHTTNPKASFEAYGKRHRIQGYKLALVNILLELFFQPPGECKSEETLA